MITADYRSRDVWLPPLAAILVVLALGAGGEPVREALRYDAAAIHAGQWWRLLTANWVHMGWWHLFLNEVGIVVLVLLCPERLPWPVWARRLLLIGTGMCVCLYFFVPRVQWYVGMSGLIHGLFVLGLVPLVRRRDFIAAVCLAYLVGKIGWEMVAGVPISDEKAIGGSVLVESHLYGVLSALAYGAVFRAFSGNETFRFLQKDKAAA
ncbi:MAG TPA: rhombosortase [Candidatus Binatia bacterium]|nr:rhombosortase [Candidatus Binatia bacterium]